MKFSTYEPFEFTPTAQLNFKKIMDAICGAFVTAYPDSSVIGSLNPSNLNLKPLVSALDLCRTSPVVNDQINDMRRSAEYLLELGRAVQTNAWDDLGIVLARSRSVGVVSEGMELLERYGYSLLSLKFCIEMPRGLDTPHLSNAPRG